ncbi:MAG: CDGSH iron-sulfur domain-containing protein [Proteobacteria bacterium]|nr:CDGSH iron-sulfur domain-containing protein [Pseudomonadota bacterium]MDA0993997.1 CDGSH iron-sulfur domain-containing protein [Pseudomonadota bacterium]
MPQSRGMAGFVYISANAAALCRCGSSNNKPFCDREHKKVGFKSE